MGSPPPLARHQFPVTERWAYLNHAGVAPIPRVAADALARWAEETMHDGAIASTAQEEHAEVVRARAAELMGVPAVDVAFVKNTSAGLGMVANGLEWSPGDRILVPNREFPSTFYPWLPLRERGVVVDVLEPVGGEWAVPVALVADRMAAGPPPRLVVLSWVQFARGWQADIPALGKLCRETGTLLCVDVIQGLGVIPCRLDEWGVDFAMADAHKWLLGPSGAGVMYVRGSRREDLRSLEPGWNAVVHREEWDNLELVLDDSARRYEGGTLNLPGITILGASIDLLLDAGIDAVWQHVDGLCHHAAGRLEELGAEILSPRDEGRSAILSFRFPGVDNGWLYEQLEQRSIAVAPRGQAIRVSPHGYNTVEDLDRLVDETAELIERVPSYERAAPPVSAGRGSGYAHDMADPRQHDHRHEEETPPTQRPEEDPLTRREALETELMEQDASEEGEEIGDEID